MTCRAEFTQSSSARSCSKRNAARTEESEVTEEAGEAEEATRYTPRAAQEEEEGREMESEADRP